tara:strand:+ start:1045 stop:1785 length:741 start_codon:yes stop_codon:yes gene_type:complete
MINPKLATSFKILSPTYLQADHYPHIVFDDFLDPTVASCLSNESKHIADNLTNKDYQDQGLNDGGDHKDQILKRSIADLEAMPFTTSLACTYFNSEVFVNYLKELTGIDDLVPDWGFQGGGIHMTYSKGLLNVHHDFNYTDSIGPKRLYRKVNLLVYLNREWETEWGGHLELWKSDLSESFKTIEIKYNRAVLFNIENAPHGHPHPLTCPTTECRRSLAFYYYSAVKPTDSTLYDRAYWLEDGKLA